MISNTLNDIDYTSFSNKEKLEMIDKVSIFLRDFNELILRDFETNPDIIIADKLFEYFSLNQKDIITKYSEKSNETSNYYYAIFLYLMGNSIGLPTLLKYANGDDLNKAIFTINKLAAKKDKHLKPIISSKLRTVTLNDNVDYIICLLNAAKDFDLQIPREFLKQVSTDTYFQVKLILKEDFNIL